MRKGCDCVKTKRMLAWLTAAALTAGVMLSGCQEVKPGESGGSSKNLTIATFVDLRIDDPGTDENPNMFYYAKQKYEEETGGTVVVKLYNDQQFLSKLVTLIGSGNSPDLVYLGSGSMPKFAAMEILQPVDDLTDVTKVNYPEAAESFVWKQKHYALRVEQIQPYMIWYNKNLLNKNGLEDPYDLWKSGEWNWEKFEELGRELTQDTDDDGNIDQWGFNTAGVYTPMWANGGDWYRVDDSGNVSITWKEAPFYNGLKFMQDAGGTWWGGEYEGFATGNVAMIGYTFEFVWLYANKMAGEDIGCVPWPAGPNFEETGGKYQTYCNLLGVAQGAGNAEGAVKFCDYMTSGEQEKNLKHTPFGNAAAEKFLTEEHWEALEYARDNSRINCTGWGDFHALSWYNPIYTNKEDIVSTLDSLEPQLRAEIDKTLSYKMPEIKEFQTPSMLTFENGDMGYLTADGCLPGAAAITGSTDEAVSGQSSLKLTSSGDGGLLVRTDPAKLELPSFWTYTVRFKWKILEEADPGMGATFYVAIRQADALDNGAGQIGPVNLGGNVGESGTFEGTISINTQLNNSVLVISSDTFNGTIVIDDLEILAG